MEIARGAEAVLTRTEDGVRKERVRKGYRHPEIDDRLREQRTRAEARMMERARAAGVPVPDVTVVDGTTLLIEDIPGEPLADVLDRRPDLSRRVGELVAILHDNDIIHGDLTTSNMLLSEDVVLIDFGLAFHSTRTEDKAVDVHVFKQALRSRHHAVYDEAFEAFLEGYGREDVLARLEVVEERGRNK